MKQLRFLIIALLTTTLYISCTPASNPSDEMSATPEIYGTGGDQSIYPDNVRD